MGYTFENGVWGSFDDKIGSWDNFHKVRNNLGFTNSRKLVSLLGDITVYSRSDASVRWPYSYLCLVQVVKSYSWVWIKDVPDLFAFLQSIQSRKQEDEIAVRLSGVSIAEEFADYLRGTYFEEALSELHTWLKKQEDK